MADKSPNLATLPSTILEGINTKLKDVHTATPGIIVSFNSEQQTASVQPAIKRIFKTIEADKEILVPTDLPMLINVPIVFPRGGGFSLTFPIAAGDECLLVFAERSIDSWHKFGGVKEPHNKRFHSLSDATAFVGLSSIPNKIPSYNPNDAVLRNDAGDQTITLAVNKDINIDTPADVNVVSGGTVNVTADTAVIVTAPTTTINGNLVVSGNITSVSGDIITDTVSMKTHKHSQANDSGGDSELDTSTAI